MAYIPHTPSDREAMLERIGVKSIEELFEKVPQELRLRRKLDIPPALSEQELEQHFAELCQANRAVDDTICFLGGGAYDHYIPSVVDAIAGRSEYYTAYTPYQAEASQGSLQAFFEYQTLICQLTGMDVANASLYEGGSAVAEAVLMAMSVTPDRKTVLISEAVHPEYRKTLATYAANLDLRIQVLPSTGGAVDTAELEKAVTDDCLCIVYQHPNFFGNLEDPQAINRICRTAGALSIISFDPISLGVLKRPGACGADIAIAEGQCLGNPLAYGGPYLGILACKQDHVRKMPGRLVGQTIDRNGKRCWVLTMQTREQHIRREKATSNICTNQGLFALRAAVYLSALGPQGIYETAELCVRKAHYAAQELCKLPGVSMAFSRPFFKEFTIRLPRPAAPIVSSLLGEGYHAGLAIGRWYPELQDCLTIAVTEKRTRAEIDGLVSALGKHLKK